jgi:hypothetical protein
LRSGWGAVAKNFGKTRFRFLFLRFRRGIMESEAPEVGGNNLRFLTFLLIGAAT